MGEDILVLTFEGTHTIEKALSVRDMLLQAMQGKKEKILINLSKIEKVDLSFLQLLHAAGIEAEKTGKILELTGDIPEDFLSAVRLAGYDKNLDGAGADLFRQMIGGGE